MKNTHDATTPEEIHRMTLWLLLILLALGGWYVLAWVVA